MNWLNLLNLSKLLNWKELKLKGINSKGRNSNEKNSKRITSKGITWKEIQPNLCAVLILALYTLVSFYHLGNAYAPSNGWESEEKGVEILLNLGEEREIGSLTTYLGKYENRSLAFFIGSGSPVVWEEISDLKMSRVYQWATTPVKKKGQYIKLVTRNQFTDIKELILADSKGVQFEPINKAEYSALFDEAWMFSGHPTFLSGTVFDESVFARTAYEYLHGIRSYEDTHPPFGKLMISIGIALFGMNPFGWRFSGTIAGILLLVMIWKFSGRLFKNSWTSVGVLALFSLDFLHFTESRLGQVDSFLVLFMTSMYYFMFRYYEVMEAKEVVGKLEPIGCEEEVKQGIQGICQEVKENRNKSEPKQNKTSQIGLHDKGETGWKYLFGSGLCMGAAISCKWSGFYGAVGLALIWGMVIVRGLRKKRITWKYVKQTFWVCCLFFLVIPAAIYLASYIPYVVFDKNMGFWERVFRNQVNMYMYHSHVGGYHDYSSRWYEWPFIIRPVILFASRFSDMTEQVIFMGNPAFWWTGIAVFFISLLRAMEKKEDQVYFLLTAYLAPIVPWVFISRYSFIYHYYPSLPFLALLIGFLADRKGKRGQLYLAACVVVSGVLFLLFYPVLSGQAVKTSDMVHWLQWLPTWNFEVK